MSIFDAIFSAIPLSGHTLDVAVTIVPFLLYGALLAKTTVSWLKVRKMADRKKERRLAALLGILALCTLSFIAANAYAIHLWGNTFLTFRVFQMFVVGNYIAYWLVLDLVSGAADEVG